MDVDLDVNVNMNIPRLEGGVCGRTPTKSKQTGFLQSMTGRREDRWLVFISFRARVGPVRDNSRGARDRCWWAGEAGRSARVEFEAVSRMAPLIGF
jgi:hypothetical protein